MATHARERQICFDCVYTCRVGGWSEPELNKCDCLLLSPVVCISRMEGSHQSLKSSRKNCPVIEGDFEEFRGDLLTLSARQEG